MQTRTYTGPVKSHIRLTTILFVSATILAGSLFGTGCTENETATPIAPVETASLEPFWPTTDGESLAPTVTPAPKVQGFTISDAPLQSWINANIVSSLVSDGASIWAATPAGLVRWTTDMQQYEIIGTEQGLLSTSIAALSIDGANRLWICYEDRLEWTYLNGQEWTSLSRTDAVESAFVEMQIPLHADTSMWAASQVTGWVWIPSENGRVQAYDGSVWRTYGSYSGVRDNISRVTVSKQGRVWALGDGLCTTIEGYVWWQDHTLFADIPNAASVTGISTDNQERVWLSFTATDGTSGGLCNLDPDLERWTGYAHALNSAIPSQVLGIQIGDDQSLCIWGADGLAIKEADTAWQEMIFEDITVYCSFIDGTGKRWLGTNRGIIRINQASEVEGPWLISESTALGNIYDVAWSDKGVLLATDDGLVQASNENLKVLTTLEPLWLSNLSGTAWYSISGLLASTDANQPVLEGHDIVTAVFAERGWAYTSDGTLWTLDGTWQTVMNILDVTGDPLVDMAIGPNQELYLATAGHIYKMGEDNAITELAPQENVTLQGIQTIAVGTDGAVWAGTSSGLYRNNDGANWVILTSNSTGGGLQSTDIRDLAFDTTGNLWLATKAGISCRTPEADWYYSSVPEATQLAIENESTAWVVADTGLYRIMFSALTPVE